MAQERLISLDAFRGLTVAAMVLVNNPASWTFVYAPLRHAAWHGWTPTDLIFPFFLFIVGMSMALSFARRAATGPKATSISRSSSARPCSSASGCCSTSTPASASPPSASPASCSGSPSAFWSGP